jgi:hypothetical protein
MSAPTVALYDVRYHHLGADSIAKPLYAVAVATYRAHLSALAGLDTYLCGRDPQVAIQGSTGQPRSDRRDRKERS